MKFDIDNLSLINYLPICSILSQIERLRKLHELGFVHNDIKLENILVGHKESNLIHLIDFGLASPYQNTDGSHIANK